MSKEKAIVHINNVSKILGTKRVKLSEATVKHLQNELCLAKKELEDDKNKVTKLLHETQKELYKSDWVSVENELPPYGENVLVCNENYPDEIWFSHRTKNWVEIDDNEFIIALNCLSITHWHRIDKINKTNNLEN